MANISQRTVETMRRIKSEGLNRVYKSDPDQTSMDIVDFIDAYSGLKENASKLALDTKNIRAENAELKEKLKRLEEREACVSRALTDAYVTADRVTAEAEAEAEKITQEAEQKAQTIIFTARMQGDEILKEERVLKGNRLQEMETAEKKACKQIARSNAQIRQIQAKSLEIVSEMARLTSKFSELTINLDGQPKTVDTLNVTFSTTTTGGEPINLDDDSNLDLISEKSKVISEKAKEISDFIKINTNELPIITDEMLEEIDEEVAVIAETAPVDLPVSVISDEIISEVSEFEFMSASVNNTRAIPVVKENESEFYNSKVKTEASTIWKINSPINSSGEEEIPAWKKVSNTEKRDFSDMNLKFGSNL